jgi:hypothetical protein
MRIAGASGASLLRVATVVLRIGVTAVRRDRRAARRDETPSRGPSADATALIYELLDAHYDTAELADGLEYDEAWAAHLEYLRALQRTGRETLARMPASGGSAPARPRRTLGDRR